MTTVGSGGAGTTDAPRVRAVGTVLLGLALAAIGVAFLMATVWSWRVLEQADAVEREAQRREAAGEAPPAGATLPATVEVEVFGWESDVSADTALFLLVIAASGVGGFVHASTSFVSFVGNRTLKRSWIAWYLFRVIIGAALATVFYLAVRAGFLTADADATSVNRFGVAALAGMAGMFSKQATDKLRELFDTLFKTTADEDRKDKLEPPVITGLEPNSAPAGSAEIEVRVLGRRFDNGTVAKVDGEARGTRFVSETEIMVTLTAADLATVGQLQVTTSGAAGPSTNSATFTLT